MKVVCTSCQKKLNVPDTAHGKKIRCPACKEIFVASEEVEVVEAVVAKPGAKPIAKAAAKPTARPGPPPMPDDAISEDLPERPDVEPGKKRKKKRSGTAEAKPFRPVQFRAIVKKKTDVLKKGNYACTVDEEGILLKVKKNDEIDIPRGTPIEHDGKNTISIEIDGEWVTMQIMRFRTYQDRFAEALVDFLNGDLPGIRVRDFEIPWAMFIFVLLPIGAPVVALAFGWLPIGITAGVCGANFAIVSKEDWTPALRITLATVTTVVLYILAVTFLILQINMVMQGRGF